MSNANCCLFPHPCVPYSTSETLAHLLQIIAMVLQKLRRFILIAYYAISISLGSYQIGLSIASHGSTFLFASRETPMIRNSRGSLPVFANELVSLSKSGTASPA